MDSTVEPIAGRHEPVLVGPVTALLAVPHGAGVLVDATVGVAGHAAALLAASGPGVHLVGFDRDPEALELAARRLAAYGQRVHLVHAGYEQLAALVAPVLSAAGPLLGVLYDLGVSSLQLDGAARGFSFRASGPLDMRMDPSAGATAADIVNATEQRELARMLRVYGEERYAPRIAAAIVRARPLTTTGQLAEVVSAAVPTPARHAGTHPATKTFQALRIVVNAELDRFGASLPQALETVAPAAADKRGGRVAVLSYHSGEDRLAKRFFADAAVGCICPPQLPVCGCGRQPLVRLLTRGAQRPDDAEVRRNPRARSARLRAAEKVTQGLLPTASSQEA